ncbi:proto-oncogene tyrosine-protein kinase ROS-like [Asterias amurensis]|uniref:proto-oncogene tyrosine-protein kinase ROS-like n=1 Tax=Asterias amurensis TaxID=7602 RepID=UPI003AB65D93
MSVNSLQNWRIFYVIWILLLIFSRCLSAGLVQQCEETCQSVLADGGFTETSSCDQTCLLNSCTAGCGLWDNTTTQSCNQACDSMFSSEQEKMESCYSGCRHAEDEYAALITALVGTPSAPFVVSMESITNTSFDISWLPASHEAVMYKLQWKYVDIEGSIWTSYNIQAVSTTQIPVTGLYPYVTYSFRIQWVITTRHVLSSPESVEVTTEPYGPPLSGPIITSLVSRSSSTISVSWLKPNFPSGPIIEHIVTVENAAGDRLVTMATSSHTFGRLVPNTSYTVTVEARNAEGTSPGAAQNVTTLPAVNDTGIQPFLVAGVTAYSFPLETKASYISFTPLDKLENAAIFPSDLHIVDVEEQTIADVAVHYWKSLLFLSDTSGTIHRRTVDVNNLESWNTSSEVIFNSSKVVTLLTVDWLFDHLYFVQENQILRCDLSCSQTPEVVIDALDSSPSELHIDPYNGFLYWSELGFMRGIYRLDLSHLIPTSSTYQQELIIEADDIESFFIDPSGFQVIFPNATNDTIVASFLDGSEQTVLRVDDGHILEYFTNVSNLIYYNELFVWTRYDDVEKSCDFVTDPYGYHAAYLYYETTLGGITESDHFFCSEAYHGLDIYHPHYQPIPTPFSPPTGLHVLFLDTTAEVSWIKPVQFETAGQGAWQEWSYEIEFLDTAFMDSVLVESIQGVTSTLVNLTAETQYSIRVRAYSTAGRGPWSNRFVGRTLKSVDVDPFVIFASTDGVKRINLDGTGLNNVINRTNIRDLAWDMRTLYWCDETGSVFQTDIMDATRAVIELPFTSYTQALAVDWFTGKLYRGTSIQQDLAIDSLNAYMYWTTTKTVECSRFTNKERFDYERLSGISDDLIAGLTVDLRGGFVYWMSLVTEDSAQMLKLFRAQLAGTGMENPASTKEEISVIPSNTERVALSFYSEKLIWINEQDDILIGNVENTSLASLYTNYDATTLTVIQPTLHPLPDGFTSVPTVVPFTIPEDSIQITGMWYNFNITWNASSEVTYGTVFYEISVIAVGVTSSATVQDAVYNMRGIDPFQSLSITLMAYTHWDMSQEVTVTRQSPMSVPTIPENSRAFVTEDKNIYTGLSNYSATFRWDPVAEVNGILIGYKVHWGSSLNSLMMRIVNHDINEIKVHNLEPNSVYYFQVEGFTAIGNGPATTLLNVSTNASSPPPILFSIGPNGITQTDIDTGMTTELLGGQSVSASAVAFIAQNELIFWADTTKMKVKSSNFDGSNEQELFAISDLPSSSGLAVDWLSRCIYITQDDEIYRYDTTISTESALTTITENETSKYLGVVVDPAKSRLYWTEQSTQGGKTLMTSDLQGQSSRPILGSQGGRRRREACSCSDSVMPSGAVAMDQSNVESAELFFADSVLGDVWASDLEGCVCRLVVRASEHAQSDLPPDSLTVDQTRVYWTNNQGIVVSADKVTGQDFRSEVVPTAEVPVLAAFGNNLQPYPDPACLAPQSYDQQAQLVSSTTSTLNLTILPIVVIPQCIGISMATVVYTLNYGKMQPSMLPVTKTTSESSVLLDNLDAFTEYSINVSAHNYYTVSDPTPGPEAIYMTGIGVPSEARDVTVIVLDPNNVKVQWLRPSQPNGPIKTLTYKISFTYMTNGTEFTGVRDNSAVRNISDDGFEANIRDLIGAQEYHFQIETFPEIGEGSSLSEVITSTTFQPPQSVQLVSSSSDELVISWMSPSDDSVMQHTLEYLYAGYVGLEPQPSNNKDSKSWTSINSTNTTGNMMYSQVLPGLLPYSHYHVRANVIYITGRLYDYSNDLIRITSYETAAGLPSAIPPPEIDESSKTLFDVIWDAPLANGPGDLTYILQAKPDQGIWKTVYNGPTRLWRAVNLTSQEAYVFRVAAESSEGIGPYSATSQSQVFIIPEESTDPMVFIIVGAVVVLLVLLAIIIVTVVIRRKMKKNAKWKHGVSVSYRTDTELATLRQYPMTIVQKDNSLYAVTTTNGAEVELPIFPRERLKLITFLGSGAFGEVFEGLAVDILGTDSGETRVAVKTLRQGATDQEKEEFLKEASLMGNFNDKHILGLLGVCLHNDPQFIILELMEGGDLLSYLRGARGTSITPCHLSPLDLIDIVMDVAKGCRYLESLKFVHRDLAARNCLVSVKDYLSPDRVVKIGDFGLARDIYKSDYYRKEGEGLLPVRWMCPEALMDGVFTVQSDVWSFGVLVWEVMTLGQQPYPARTNVEVLHYVTSGGRLDRPDNCPDDIHHLMLKCWEKQPEGRPSFHSTLEKLDSYRRKSASMSSGVDNPGFEGDSIKYLRLGGGGAQGNEDYLQPMDSAQSLHRNDSSDSLAEVKARAREDARRYQEQQGQDAYSTQGARPKPKQSKRDSLGLPQEKRADLEPRYTAAPSSFSKATGANVPKPEQVTRQASGAGATAASREKPTSKKMPLNMKGSWVDPEKKARGIQKDRKINNQPEESKSPVTVVSVEEPVLLSKPSTTQRQRAPNPFRQDSVDEAERRDYTNWPKTIPEDPFVFEV